MKQHPFHSWGKFVSSKRTRWITLLVWVLLTVVLSFTFPSVNEVENNTADNLPKQTMSQKADQLIKKEFPTDSGNPLLIVWNRKDGLNEEDYKVIQTVYKEIRTNPLKNQLTSPSYDLMPIQAIKRSSSEDGSTIITAVLFDKKADDKVLQKISTY